MSPFTRDGHLSDLGLELFDGDELSSADAEAVRAHLATCAVCRTRYEAFAGVAPLAPSASAVTAVPAPVPRPANRPWAWAAGGLALVAAILLAVVAGSTSAVQQAATGEDAGDGLRLKGRGLSLQVLRAEPDGSTALVSPHGTIHPGDRLGFVVSTTRDGQLMVLAADPTGRVDVCYPQGAATSAPWSAGGRRSLPVAVEADAVLGEARFVALRCDHGFSVADGRRVALGGAPGEGCVSEEVVLDKVPR